MYVYIDGGNTPGAKLVFYSTVVWGTVAQCIVGLVSRDSSRKYFLSNIEGKTRCKITIKETWARD